HGTGDAVRVRVRDASAKLGLVDGFVEVVGKVGAERPRAHRRTVAEGALAIEQSRGRFVPAPALGARLKIAMGSPTVAAPRLAEVTAQQRVCEVVGLDLAVLAQTRDDLDR